MLVPVFLLILLGMLEFGFAFNHHLTLENATREGARTGATAADGTTKDSSCVDSSTGLPRSFGPADVDPLIIAAVDRTLRSPGSMIDMAQVTDVKIYRVSNLGSDGEHLGQVDGCHGEPDGRICALPIPRPADGLRGFWARELARQPDESTPSRPIRSA